MSSSRKATVKNRELKINPFNLQVKEMWIGNVILSCSAKIFEKVISFRIKKQNAPNIYQYDLHADDILRMVFHSASSTTGIIVFFAMPSTIKQMRISFNDNHITSGVITIILNKFDLQNKILLHGYVHQLTKNSCFGNLMEEVDRDTLYKILRRSLIPLHLDRFHKYFPKRVIPATSVSTASTLSTNPVTSTSTFSSCETNISQSSDKITSADLIDEILCQSGSASTPISLNSSLNLSSTVLSSCQQVSNIDSSIQSNDSERDWIDPNFMPFPDQSQTHNDFISQILSETSTNISTEEKKADEDEVIVASEKVSVKCPITQVIMKEAMLNKKCKHSYDLNGIQSYLNSRKGKITNCPVSGCTNKNLQMEDLLPNVKLQNLINRRSTELNRNIVKL